MAEFDYTNTILIVKPVGSDAAASLRSEHNTKRLKSFCFEVGVSSIPRDKNNRYGISKQHFRIDFNSDSGFLRLKNMSSTNGNGMTAPSVNNGYQLLEYNMHMLHPAEQTRSMLAHLYSKSFHFEDGVSSVSEYEDSIVHVATVASSFPLHRIRVNSTTD